MSAGLAAGRMPSGTRLGQSMDWSGSRRKKPVSAGSRCSCRWANQPGWVQSPVATTAIPLTAAQAARPCRWLALLVARE